MSIVKEIIKTCEYFKVKGITDNPYIEKRITDNLGDIAFIETLLDIFTSKAKLKQFSGALDIKRLQNLLNQLEEIRTDLD